ncbi:OmpA family protein [Roseococcus sp. DSY-14]|uniref:OmpA family protein n=1 Tax=Roseococcus sp. DSY-14 TaxID=3369650 RepID=UPI00387AF93D
MRRLFLLAPLAVLAACATVDDEPVRTVFFTPESAALDPAARQVVAGAAGRARRFPNSRITVRGYTGPAGDSAANQALSRARAEAVAAGLREAGVAPGRITVSARGEVPFDLAPVESRRVEVHFD